jgi:hypothetical protein
MDLRLTEDEARALHELLRVQLGDLSAEIAATDNPAFRRQLRGRRDLLHRVHTALGAQLSELPQRA